MKLYFLHSLLFLLAFATFSLGSPINTTEEEIEISDHQNKLTKRYDVNTYLSSVGHSFLSKDIKHESYEGSNGNTNIDIYYSIKDRYTKNPVVIYIYGGSWYLGEKSLYSKLGDNLRDRGFITVIPNYVQFPFGNLDGMIYDITNAIKWVYNHIEEYGGDKDNIIVLGHSSGAHLLALTIIRNSLGLGLSTFNYKHHVYGLPPLKRAVLLNGPYDFDLLSEEAKETGIKIENSNTRKILETALSSFDASPTDVLKRYGNKSIKSFKVESIVLMHAEEDATVPVASSNDLLKEIERTSSNPAVVYLTHGYYHCGITEGIMNKDEGAIRYIIKALMADLEDLKKETENGNYFKMNNKEIEKEEREDEENEENEAKVKSFKEIGKNNEKEEITSDEYFVKDDDIWTLKDSNKKNDYFNVSGNNNSYVNSNSNYNSSPIHKEKKEKKPWWKFW